MSPCTYVENIAVLVHLAIDIALFGPLGSILISFVINLKALYLNHQQDDKVSTLYHEKKLA